MKKEENLTSLKLRSDGIYLISIIELIAESLFVLMQNELRKRRVSTSSSQICHCLGGR